MGRRRSKTIGSTTTQFLADELNFVQKQDGGGTATANLLTGGLDETFTRTDSGGASAFLVDGLGSTLELADSSGTLQTHYTYEPFGATTATGASSTNAGQFTGRENDGTGLYYYRARFYSPALQRFIAEDPIGLGGGLNLSAYAANSPTAFIDPFGFKPCSGFGSCAGAGSDGSGKGGSGGGNGAGGDGGAGSGDAGGSDPNRDRSSCQSVADANYEMTKDVVDPLELGKDILLKGLRAEEVVAATLGSATLSEALLGSGAPTSVFTATIPTIEVGSVAGGAVTLVATVWATDYAFRFGLRAGSYISAKLEGCQ